MRRPAILLTLATALLAAVCSAMWLRHQHDTNALRVQPGQTTVPGPGSGTLLAALTTLSEPKNLEQARQPASPFWLHDAEAEAQRIEQILEAERAVRAELVARFGPQITNAAVFRQLFRPLHERLPQLNSQQQIELHELERQFVSESLRPGSDASFEQLLMRVRERLGVELASEYALRSSPLANELHQTGVQFSESEFRTAFAELSKLNEAADAEQFIAARQRLRDALGTTGFARLWSIRDTRYQQIESVANRHALSSDTTLAAYALLLENEDAMLAAVASTDAAAHQDLIRRQYADGRRRLHELVGERAADALLQAATAAPRESRQGH